MPGAAKWTVAPQVTLREIYTDNAAFSATPRRGDFITEVSPRIVFDSRGARFNSNVDYSASRFFYAHTTELNRTANQLNAFGNLEAIEKLFYVDVGGNIQQGFISPLEPQPSDSSTGTTNRIEARTFSLSPYVQGQAGEAILYEVRNLDIWTRTNNSLLPPVRSEQWTGRLSSVPRLFGWAIDYDNTKIESGLVDPPGLKSSLVRGQLYFLPDSGWRFSASAGSETNNYGPGAEQRSYYTRGAGVAWKPGPRTSAEFQIEHRFFGPARTARLDHRTRLTAWSLSYSRGAATFQQDLLRPSLGNTAALLDSIFAARISDPLERRAAVARFMRASSTPAALAPSLAFFTPQIFLEDRLEGSAGILGSRNSLMLTGFRQRSKPLSIGRSTVFEDVLSQGGLTQDGFGIGFSHRITPFTSVEASARRARARQENTPGIQSRNDNLALTLTNTVSPRTTTFVGVASTRFSTSAGQPADINAKLAFVGVNIRF